MNNLIPLGTGSISGEPVQTVNARDLHVFLGVGKDFSTWIKGRIDEYEFLEGKDFVIVEHLRSPNSGNAKARTQRVIDYHLSLDMGKELAMVEKTAKGREARRYFIECERIAKQAMAGRATPRPQAAPKPAHKPHAGKNINFLNLPPNTPHPLELQKRLNETEAALGRSRKQAGAHLRGLVGSMQAMNASLRDIATRVDEIGANIQAPHNSFPKMARAAEHDGNTPLPCRVPHPPTIRTQAQHDLLIYFKKHGTHVSTYRTISAETGLPWPTVRNVVAKFVGEGILAKTSWSSGSNRALCFIVAY